MLHPWLAAQAMVATTCGTRTHSGTLPVTSAAHNRRLSGMAARDRSLSREAVCGSNGSILCHATARMNHKLAHQAAFHRHFQ